jgi:glycosyltransferase involved in cell wall biosynthesis
VKERTKAANIEGLAPETREAPPLKIARAVKVREIFALDRVTRPSILHITEAMGGGVQSAIVNYVNATDRYDHVVVARERSDQGTYDLPPGVKLIVIRGTLMRFLREASAYIKSDDHSIVHLHSSYAGALRAFVSTRHAIAYSPHCFAMERQDLHRPARLFARATEKILSRRSNQIVIAVSPAEALIAQKLWGRSTVFTVPNPAPEISIEHDPSETLRRKRICMVGRICPQKGPEMFAAAARNLSNLGIESVWVGDGDPAMRIHLENAGVSVTGWLSPRAAREVVASSALYTHTAKWEGAPLSAIESAAVGTPVISRTINSMTSLGYVTFGTTAESMSDSVKRFFRDADFRSSVAHATSLVASSNTHEIMKRELDSAYLRLSNYRLAARTRHDVDKSGLLMERIPK